MFISRTHVRCTCRLFAFAEDRPQLTTSSDPASDCDGEAAHTEDASAGLRRADRRASLRKSNAARAATAVAASNSSVGGTKTKKREKPPRAPHSHSFETICERAARLCWQKETQSHSNAKSIFCGLAGASWKQQLWRARVNVLKGGTAVSMPIAQASSASIGAVASLDRGLDAGTSAPQRARRKCVAKANANASKGGSPLASIVKLNRQVVAVGGQRGGCSKILNASSQQPRDGRRRADKGSSLGTTAISGGNSSDNGDNGDNGDGGGGGGSVGQDQGGAATAATSATAVPSSLAGKGKPRRKSICYTLDGPRHPTFNPADGGETIWVCEYKGHCVTKLGWGGGQMQVLQRIEIVQAPYEDADAAVGGGSNSDNPAADADNVADADDVDDEMGGSDGARVYAVTAAGCAFNSDGSELAVCVHPCAVPPSTDPMDDEVHGVHVYSPCTGKLLRRFDSKSFQSVQMQTDSYSDELMGDSKLAGNPSLGFNAGIAWLKPTALHSNGCLAVADYNHGRVQILDPVSFAVVDVLLAPEAGSTLSSVAELPDGKVAYVCFGEDYCCAIDGNDLSSQPIGVLKLPLLVGASMCSTPCGVAAGPHSASYYTNTRRDDGGAGNAGGISSSSGSSSGSSSNEVAAAEGFAVCDSAVGVDPGVSAGGGSAPFGAGVAVAIRDSNAVPTVLVTDGARRSLLTFASEPSLGCTNSSDCALLECVDYTTGKPVVPGSTARRRPKDGGANSWDWTTVTSNPVTKDVVVADMISGKIYIL